MKSSSSSQKRSSSSQKRFSGSRKQFNVVGFGVCGPFEQHLHRTLNDLQRLCDTVVIVGNNIDQESAKEIESRGIILEHDNRVWGKFQNKIKEDAVARLSRYFPDWVLTLDMDETFDENFTRAELNKLMVKGGYGYFFYVVNLYEDGYAKDWCFWNNRLFRYEGDLRFAQKPLHCGLAPEIHWKYSNYAPFLLFHRGLQDQWDRERKARRYKQFDPNAQHMSREYYAFLESKAPVTPLDVLQLREEVQREVKDYKFKSKIPIMTEKKFYYVKNPKGMILDIPDYQLEETLAREGFSLVSHTAVVVGGTAVKSTTTETPEATAEVTAPEAVEGFDCDVCGFIAKSKAGLTKHAKKHA